MGFNGTLPAKGRKDGGMELKEEMEPVFYPDRIFFGGGGNPPPGKM